MRAWLIYDSFEAERNKRYIGFYFDECSRMGISLELLIREKLRIAFEASSPVLYSEGVRQSPPDFAVCRVQDYILSRHMELMGIPVFNSSEVSRVCNNKFLTYQLAASAGADVLDTRLSRAKFPCEPPEFPFVVKTPDGKGGNEVFLVKDEKEFARVKEVLGDRDFLTQRAAEDIGRDLRVYVIGKRVLASVLRVSDTDFRSNFCLGGRAELYSMSPEEKKIVDRLASSMDFGFVGIDFLFGNGHMYFNEIEDVVGSRMLYSLTDINPVREYLGYITECIRSERT